MQDLTAERFATVEIAAGLRAGFVERAKPRYRIERDAGAVAVLIHAAHAIVFDNKFLGDEIARAQLDYQMAAAATTGAGREIGVSFDNGTQTVRTGFGDF